VLLLGLGLRLALDPLVTWRTRVVLNDMEGYRGRFSDVKLSLRDLSYRIEGLRLEKTSAGGAALPFLEVRKAEIGLYWKELVRGHVVAAIRLEGPELNLVAADEPEERQLEDSEDVGFKLTELAPMRVDRFEVQDGVIAFTNRRSPREPKVRLQRVEATIENFATREALARGEPTVVALRGVLQRTGKVSLFASTDPLAKKLTFAGQFTVDGLKLAELGDLLADESGLRPTHGELDMSARFVAKEGVVSGGVRPIVKDAGVEAARPGLGNKLKALLVDVALDLFSDDVPRRDALATTIPIHGTLDSPQIEAVPTILGIVRNAFVAGLANSLENLPPRGERDPARVDGKARRGEAPRRAKQGEE
jgi:hypothetical protein